MPTIGNKRVTQLVELTSAEVDSSDWLLIIDNTARESKKISSSEFSAWLNASGSIYAIHADNADTASWAYNIVGGLVPSASWSNLANSAISASLASFSISASWALTSSFSQNSNGGSAVSASWASRSLSSSYSSLANFSNSASYLIYFPGGNNGTASYSIKTSTVDLASSASFLKYTGTFNGTASYALQTQNTNHSIQADTASYLNNIGPSVSTASYAISSSYTPRSDSSSFLIYSPSNGTASYAMAVASFNGDYNYGVFLSITQSATQSILDTVDVLSSLGITKNTPIQAVGTVNVSYTSSIPTTGILNLTIKDRNTGIETLFDSTPINLNMSPTMGTWESYDSGTISLPFSLMGQSSLSGSYMVYVSASSNLKIEPTRLTRFSINSKSDVVNVYANEPLQFSYTPSSTLSIYSSSMGGPFTGNNQDILSSGSSNITVFDISYTNITSVRYMWTLPSLTKYIANNSQLSVVGNLPPSVSYFDCSSGFITSINDLSGLIFLQYFNCSNNNLTSLPNLPNSLTYLNYSNNGINQVPNFLPTSLISLYGDSTYVYNINNFPTNLITASISTSSLITLPSLLPASMSYLNVGSSFLSSFPSVVPVSMSYLNLAFTNLNTSTLEYITSQLFSNNMLSGTLDIRGYGPISSFSPTLLVNVTNLQTNNDWNIYYDP